MMGKISGSSVANVVTCGTFTIPLVMSANVVYYARAWIKDVVGDVAIWIVLGVITVVYAALLRIVAAKHDLVVAVPNTSVIPLLFFKNTPPPALIYPLPLLLLIRV